MPRSSALKKHQKRIIATNSRNKYSIPAKSLKSNLKKSVQIDNSIQPLTIHIDADSFTITAESLPNQKPGRKHNKSKS